MLRDLQAGMVRSLMHIFLIKRKRVRSTIAGKWNLIKNELEGWRKLSQNDGNRNIFLKTIEKPPTISLQ